MIDIFLNGEKKQIAENLTLFDLISGLSYPIGSFAAAVNETFIPRSQYQTHTIHPLDRIEIVVPMQGG